MHFHTVYGFPRHGLKWTDDEHETLEAAWEAVGQVVGENWRQDKARIHAHGERHGNVKGAYARAAMLCIRGNLPAGASFEIPALDSDHDGMTYAVVECSDNHAQGNVTRKVG